MSCGNWGKRVGLVVMASVADPWIPEDTFGARLARLRQALGGWNVKRAADFCGLPDASWHNWEAGRSTPRDLITVCRKIHDATGVNYIWLIAGSPAAPSTGWLTALEPLEPAA